MRIADWENSNSRPDVVQFHEFRMKKDRQVVRAFGYVNIPTMADVPAAPPATRSDIPVQSCPCGSQHQRIDNYFHLYTFS